MKLTKSKLQQIIKEEFDVSLEEPKIREASSGLEKIHKPDEGLREAIEYEIKLLKNMRRRLNKHVDRGTPDLRRGVYNRLDTVGERLYALNSVKKAYGWK